jgi:YegS/Rv2252/BmrU family lipid kinase
MSVFAIINPISGAGADPATAERRVATIRAAAARRSLPVDIHVTERGGHARELAEAAAAGGAHLVIVWGGDGTINEAGSALMHTGVTLGIVPAGSGNGLAAALDVSREPETAVAAAFDGRDRIIDVGMMAGRAFMNIGGIGFDARVARLFNARAAGSRGGWPYLVIGVREGCRYCAGEYEIELDGEKLQMRALLMSFANGREYGIGARIAPDARVDDGLLDATLVAERPVLTRFWHARHLAYGTPHLAPSVTTRRVKHAVIRSSQPMEYHVDGEPGVAEGGVVEVRILPGALRIRS